VAGTVAAGEGWLVGSGLGVSVACMLAGVVLAAALAPVAGAAEALPIRKTHATMVLDTIDKFLVPHLETRAVVIPNAVYAPSLTEEPKRAAGATKTAYAMGRLEHQKGFDILLRAFAAVKDKQSDWELTILGEGPLRADLERLIRELGLSGRAHLPGWVPNPARLLNDGDLFVLSSRFEGFPNSLCEAMACGIPVISTDCPTGPDGIVRHEVDGILVPTEDVEALSAAMDRLMSNEEERRELARRAPEILERFAPDKVMGLWEDLLDRVIERS